MAQDIRRLTNLAYPTAPSDVRETLAKEQFVDSIISSDMRLRIKQARPQSLNEVVRHAVELEACNKAERKYQEDHGFIRSVSDSDQMALKKDVQDLKKALSDVQSMLKTYNRDNAANEKKNRTVQPFQSNKGNYRKFDRTSRDRR